MKDYEFLYAIEKDSDVRTTVPVIHADLILRTGGGFYDAENTDIEVVNALLYSPRTNCLEIAEASYDKKEDLFYMDIRKFHNFLENYGNPGLNIAVKGVSKGKNLSSLNDESILKAFGYDVSQTTGLRAQERRTILTELVDLKNITIPKIVSLLNYFINLHSQSKDALAREKWREDKEYISQYKINPDRFIIPY